MKQQDKWQETLASNPDLKARIDRLTQHAINIQNIELDEAVKALKVFAGACYDAGFEDATSALFDALPNKEKTLIISENSERRAAEYKASPCFGGGMEDVFAPTPIANAGEYGMLVLDGEHYNVVATAQVMPAKQRVQNGDCSFEAVGGMIREMNKSLYGI